MGEAAVVGVEKLAATGWAEGGVGADDRMVGGPVLAGLDAESLLGYRWYLSASELVDAGQRWRALADGLREVFQPGLRALDFDTHAV
ncbi:hypothetical protein ES705_24328 [subsurface metagenome]